MVLLIDTQFSVKRNNILPAEIPGGFLCWPGNCFRIFYI